MKSKLGILQILNVNINHMLQKIQNHNNAAVLDCE